MRYLLDTNICVFLFRGSTEIEKRLGNIGKENCFISDVTVAELRYGIECSSRKKTNTAILEDFLKDITVIPFDVAIDAFAKEKARLRKFGLKIDDFDLLIGCTAKATDMTMVTDNIKHFERISGIKLENWMTR